MDRLGKGRRYGEAAAHAAKGGAMTTKPKTKATHYARGRRFEYKTMKRLESEGYDCTRAAGSHGVWDVVAVRKDHIRFVQVKCGTRGISSLDREIFGEWECPGWSPKEVWFWPTGARDPIVEVI